MSSAEVEPNQAVTEPQIPVVSFDTALGEDFDYRSLNKRMPRDLTEGFSSGDHLGIVLSHEAKHASDKTAGVKTPRNERLNLAAHAATTILSKAGWFDIAANFFTGDKIIPYQPYIYLSLGAIGTNFLFRKLDPASKRYYRSQIERSANQYALDSLEKGGDNPWRNVIYLQPK